eukprot:6193224-Pleurochrysis_carterae.AAC.1
MHASRASSLLPWSMHTFYHLGCLAFLEPLPLRSTHHTTGTMQSLGLSYCPPRCHEPRQDCLVQSCNYLQQGGRQRAARSALFLDGLELARTSQRRAGAAEGSSQADGTSTEQQQAGGRGGRARRTSQRHCATGAAARKRKKRGRRQGDEEHCSDEEDSSDKEDSSDEEDSSDDEEEPADEEDSPPTFRRGRRCHTLRYELRWEEYGTRL